MFETPRIMHFYERRLTEIPAQLAGYPIPDKFCYYFQTGLTMKTYDLYRFECLTNKYLKFSIRSGRSLHTKPYHHLRHTYTI